MRAHPLVPPPLPFAAAWSRHTPTRTEQREQVLALAAHRPWTGLPWPELLDSLAALGRTDIPLSRLTEGQVDAQRIIAEAGAEPVSGAAYGVWASRSHGTGVRARQEGSTWVLDGTLRFASGAGVIDRALVPVWLDPDTHVLLDLDVSRWDFDESAWRTRAMELSRSHTAQLVGVRVETGSRDGAARVIGGPNFYLSRPGFFPGGVGVAAVWAGGAVRVLDLLDRAVPQGRRSSAQQRRMGVCHVEVVAALANVTATGPVLADALADGTDPGRLHQLSAECRSAVAAGVRRLLTQARTVAGPAATAYDEDLSRALDDLGLYVAQHNADADAEWLGGLGGPGWGDLEAEDERRLR